MGLQEGGKRGGVMVQVLLHGHELADHIGEEEGVVCSRHVANC